MLISKKQVSLSITDIKVINLIKQANKIWSFIMEVTKILYCWNNGKYGKLHLLNDRTVYHLKKVYFIS
jgi:hypothetical protein